MDVRKQVLPRKLRHFYDNPLKARQKNMYTLDQNLVFGNPSSAFPLLFETGAVFTTPGISNAKQNVAARQKVVVGTSNQADLSAPGVRDLLAHPSYTQRFHRTEAYDAQRSANNNPQANFMDRAFDWFITGDWYRHSQAEWRTQLRDTAQYTRAGTQWVDHGQWNHFPPGLIPLRFAVPATTTPFQ